MTTTVLGMVVATHTTAIETAAAADIKTAETKTVRATKSYRQRYNFVSFVYEYEFWTAAAATTTNDQQLSFEKLNAEHI